MSRLNTYKVTTMLSKNGSTENGTVHGGDFLAAIKNRLYLCLAFETQVQDGTNRKYMTNGYQFAGTFQNKRFQCSNN